MVREGEIRDFHALGRLCRAWLGAYVQFCFIIFATHVLRGFNSSRSLRRVVLVRTRRLLI